MEAALAAVPAVSAFAAEGLACAVFGAAAFGAAAFGAAAFAPSDSFRPGWIRDGSPPMAERLSA